MQLHTCSYVLFLFGRVCVLSCSRVFVCVLCFWLIFKGNRLLCVFLCVCLYMLLLFVCLFCMIVALCAGLLFIDFVLCVWSFFVFMLLFLFVC